MENRSFAAAVARHPPPSRWVVPGSMLADRLVTFWRALGAPRRFALVEFGAGRGELARDVLTRLETAHPECFEATRYVIGEV
jgi:SAM-dependent MidA family methyltransferase